MVNRTTRALIKLSDRPAIFWQGQSVSFRSVLFKAAQYGTFLPQTPRFRAVILSENRPEFIYALYAVWHRGGVPVLFDHTLPADEIAAILNASMPDIIISSAASAEKLAPVLRGISLQPPSVVFESIPDLPALSSAPDSIGWSGIDDTALIVYTSGTTGTQKGAMLSFGNLLSNLEPVLEFAADDDATLLLLPLYHIFPLLWTVIAPLYAGVPTVIAPSLEPGDIIATLRLHPVTAIVGVPLLFERLHKAIVDRVRESAAGRMLFALARAVGSPAFSRLVFRRVHTQFGGRIRYFICGGAALDPDVQRDFWTLGLPMYTGYGLTETSPMVSFNKPGRVRLGSVGQLIPDTSVRIEQGEIVVSGTNVMQGYDRRPDETLAVLRDGWLYTGDLGRIDDEGYLYVTGRKKETVILPNGKNINPEEVEQRLAAERAFVKEAAVYERNGKLAALFVPQPQYPMNGGSPHDAFKWNVIDVYNRTAPLHRKIYYFTLTSATLPRTSLGKLKRHLIPTIADDQGSRVQGTDQPSAASSPLLRYIQMEMRPTARFEDDFVTDLGMDSLDLAVFLSHIEANYNIVLSPDDVMQHQTVGALSAYIQQFIDALPPEEQEWQRMFDGMDEVPLPRTWPTIHVWQWMLRIAYRSILHVSISGRERIPAGPVIFAANHQSSLDPFLVTCFLPPRRFRDTFYLAKEFHYRAAWKQWLVDRHNVVLVHPTEALSLSLRTLGRCLGANRSVLIFPEGTRSENGALTEFKRSFAFLSCALGVPVVPVVIAGTSVTLPKGKALPKYGVPVSVKFLAPVHPDGHTPSSLTFEVFSLIESELAASKPAAHSQSGS